MIEKSRLFNGNVPKAVDPGDEIRLSKLPESKKKKNKTPKAPKNHTTAVKLQLQVRGQREELDV